jgi:hypothetical protein
MSTGDIDTEGRPILIQVAIAGDDARRKGIVLEVEPEGTPAATTNPANEDHLERYLRERIEQAVRSALPQATQQTLDRMRRSANWYKDE